jgi:hypothetical protein
VFSSEHSDFLEGVFRSVCADFEAELVEFNGDTAPDRFNNRPDWCRNRF